MAPTSKIFTKLKKGMQRLCAGLTAIGMVAVFAPSTAVAESWRQGFNGGHVSGLSGNRGFVNHRGFNSNRGFRHNRGFQRNRGFKGHRGFNNRRGFHGNRGFHSNRKFRRHRNGNGAAIAAGIIGFTAGALIISQANRNKHYHSRKSYVSLEPWSPGWYRACARKYRSFNPDTGRYLSYSGRYKICRL